MVCIGVQIYGHITIEATEPLLLQLTNELDFTRPGRPVRIRKPERHTGE